MLSGEARDLRTSAALRAQVPLSEQPSAIPDEAQRVLQRDTEAMYHTLRALPVQSLCIATMLVLMSKLVQKVVKMAMATKMN